ncbi:MAG TPA: hypothetical protein VFC78_09340 [Tepidisphaeraceae bacterium]|nr:hypothetical protein [Tepidisphaeraceae bacterium]
MDAKLYKRLEKSLGVIDDHGTVGPRLLDDAQRLWDRVRRFIGMGLVPSQTLDLQALELACHALQLPLRRPRLHASGRPTRSTLRERTEEAAELLIGVAIGEASEELLDRTARILHEMPHRNPMFEEAKLLADALNLEDFGLTGLINLALQTDRQGGGVGQVADGLEKREQYGYWHVRLKDGFHFDPIRALAQKRLDHAREAAKRLAGEIAEDKL